MKNVISGLAELADCGQLEIPRVQEYDAAEWLEPAGVENELASLGLELTADTTDEELDALAGAIRESANLSVESDGDCITLYGLDEYLESYREELIEEAVKELDDELGQVVTQLDELATRRDDLIRRIYRLGRSSYREIAEKVGLSHESIRRIVAKITE